MEFPEALFSPDKPIIKYGECHCGCKEKTRLAPQSLAARGWFKDEPVFYRPGHHVRMDLPAYKINEASGCWDWLGLINNDGYGKISQGRRPLCAHRVFYERFCGEIPSGLQIDHLCRNRGCVRPSHLEAVTQQENIRRGETGKHFGSRTHCKNGHEFDEKNTAPHMLHGKRIGRKCRACHRLREFNRRHGNMERAREYQRAWRRNKKMEVLNG